MVDLVEIKSRARRAIHGKLAVPAMLIDEDNPLGVAITVRWHNKIAEVGDLDGEYSSVIEGIDRLIFSDSEIAAINEARAAQDPPLAPLVLSRNAEVSIPGYKGATFDLDSQEPADGPEETVWVVARRRG